MYGYYGCVVRRMRFDVLPEVSNTFKVKRLDGDSRFMVTLRHIV